MTLVVVTGDKELDAKLANLPTAMQRKFIRGALKTGSKRVVAEFQKIVKAEAYDTGTLHDAAKVKPTKRSRSRIGVSMFIDREKLFAAYATKHAGHPPHPAKGAKGPFYYPAVIEFGDDRKQPIRPMRRALYDHAAAYRELFIEDVNAVIEENKVAT